MEHLGYIIGAKMSFKWQMLLKYLLLNLKPKNNNNSNHLKKLRHKEKFSNNKILLLRHNENFIGSKIQILH